MSILIQLTQPFHLSKVWDVGKRAINAQVLIQTLKIFVILQEEITLKLVQIFQSSSVSNTKRTTFFAQQLMQNIWKQRSVRCMF